MLRDTLLSIHLFGAIAWVGAGFFQLYLGRLFLAQKGSVLEAPLIRIVYGSDFVVFAATVLVFLAGIGLAICEGYWFFTTLWLGVKQAIMLVVVAIVVFIFPAARQLNIAIGKLPPGSGPANDEIRGLYRSLEPWYWLMRLLAVAAVLLAIWRP
jgi:hypothetical protein